MSIRKTQLYLSFLILPLISCSSQDTMDPTAMNLALERSTELEMVDIYSAIIANVRNRFENSPWGRNDFILDERRVNSAREALYSDQMRQPHLLEVVEKVRAREPRLGLCREFCHPKENEIVIALSRPSALQDGEVIVRLVLIGNRKARESANEVWFNEFQVRIVETPRGWVVKERILMDAS